jgi:uncharacterized protein with NRDE domain
MCLILFAYGVRTDAPLIVAANRDEFYARPADAAHRWHDVPTVLAGRDLQAGGTWLGVSATGRFAAVTNFSETPEGPLPPGSRGDLTADFLRGDAGALDYANTIDGRRYRGFSLLLWDGAALVYTSNRNSRPRLMPKGVHGLANTHLDGTWPKVVRGTPMLASLVAADCGTDDLIKLLEDERPAADHELPQRGNDIAFERRLSPIFIRGDEYGTRASTAVIIGTRDIRVSEQSFGPGGVRQGRVDETLVLTRPNQTVRVPS